MGEVGEGGLGWGGWGGVELCWLERIGLKVMSGTKIKSPGETSLKLN